MPKSKALYDKILEELRKRYNIRQVRQYLQREYNLYSSTSRDAYINTIDVYNIFTKYRQELYSRHKDDFKSIKKRLAKLQQHGYHMWIDLTDGQEPRQRLNSTDFAFGFVALWQRNYFSHAQFVSLDATYNVSRYKDGVLYTMVVRDSVAGHGVPITYLFTNDLSSRPLLGWLHSLSLIGLNPQRFTIDRSLPEDNAIIQVWPSCSIQHCIWHVIRAWMQNVQSKVHGSVGRMPVQAKAHIRPRLKELMYASDCEHFHILLNNFLAEFSHSQPEFTSYFKTYYIEMWNGTACEHWNASYQPTVFHAMQMNNFVEVTLNIILYKHK